MANPEHVEILKQGVEVWNRWREDHPDSKPDLSKANLPGAKLHGILFSRTRLIETNLSWANLSEADLSDADLCWADLSEALLTETNFSKALLSWADLSGSNLSGANLSSAILREANFSKANLARAVLTDSHLSGANFTEANLAEAELRNSKLKFASFVNVNLGKTKNLQTVIHYGPSYIDISTIYKTAGNISESFLRGCGVPENFIQYMSSLTRKAFDFYSCFISYSSKDQGIAKRLHADLQHKGVRCWFAPEDMKFGDNIRDRIDQSIKLHDKLLLVLSEHSINSEWVEDEVDSAYEQEQMRKKPVLFPIRLDDAVMDTDKAWAAKLRRSRNIGDFTKWKDHDSYRKAFNRLMRDLKVEPK